MADNLEADTVDDSKLVLPKVKLEKVETKTHEEDEDVLFVHRCRLYRFRDEQWKQRGTGDCKLLRHREMNKVRFILRQEKTLKVQANHLVPDVEMEPSEGSDTMWMWSAMDFSEGDLQNETFLIKFKTNAIGKTFIEAWDKARAINAMTEAAEAAGGSSGGAVAAAAPEEPEDAVPSYGDLSSIYPGSDALLEASKSRYAALAARFTERFGKAPSHTVRAPGRVNLIGEHIDYHHYPVLPMALEHDIVIAAAVGDEISDADLGASVVTVANFESKYPDGECPADPAAEVDHESGVSWFQYFQCGYKGAFEVQEGVKPRKLEVMIDGRVPPGAGVSSSSALVVASLLASATAHGIKMSRMQLATSAVATERHIGTMSGGMDQTISVFGEAGGANLIEFNPIKVHPVTLPESGVFLVVNSLTVANKAVDPDAYYNLRVVEGKFAAKLVGKKAGCDGWKGFKTILDLQQALGLAAPGGIAAELEKHLKAEPYTKAELATEFGEDVAGLFEGDPKQAGALKVLGTQDSFKLLRRARHVATEATRVQQFCEAAMGGGDVATLGELMNASQDSCANDYECSCDALDEVCRVARAAGAAGARLTGAGWGGCAVVLAEADKVDAVKAELAAKFFEPRRAALDEAGLTVDSALFASRPAPGAAIFDA